MATPRTGRRIPFCLVLTCLLAMPAVLAQERGSDPSATEKIVQQQLGPAGKQLAAASEVTASEPFVVPANDTCTGAVTIPGAGPFPHLTTPVDLFDATTAGDPTPSCPFQGVFSRGIWYSFTPSISSVYRFSTCGSNAPGTNHPDTVLAVFNAAGGCTAGAEVGCNDDDSGCGTSNLQSTVSVGLTAGTQYYVLAYSWNTTAPTPGQSTVQIQVREVGPPPNDVCAGAVALPLGGLEGTNSAAANNYTLSGAGCFTGVGQTSSTAVGRDTVYSFTAPSAGSYSFRVQTFEDGGTNSGNLVLYTAPTCPSPGAISCVSPTVRASNRNTGQSVYLAAEEILCQPMANGETTFIFVDETALVTAGGGYLIEANLCGLETEANGTPATANAVNACPMEGTISPAADIDFFSLGTPAAGTRVFAIADGIQANNVDFDMRVTTTTDTLEFDAGDNSAPWGATSPNIAGRALTGVASFLRMNLGTGVASEPYRLHVVTQPPGADAYGSSSSPEVNDAGNSTLGGAETAGNNYFRGTISRPPGDPNGSDLDAFRFCAQEGDIITINIDADPGRNLTPINPAVFLFDELGSQLAGFTDGAVTSNNTSGAGSLTSTTPNSPGESMTWRARYSGTYFAGINPQAATNIPGASDYLISIGVNCQNGASQSALIETDVTAPANVNAGQSFDYLVDLTNDGPNSALDVEFTQTLPTGVQFLGIDGTGTDFASCDMLPPPNGTGTVRCKVECLRPGGNFQFIISVRANSCTGPAVLNSGATTTCKTATAPGSILSDPVTTNVTDTGACEDGDLCTSGDTCSGTTCVGGGPTDCNDSDPCTIDTCDSVSGCLNSLDVGSICDDADPCTEIDICLEDGACHGLMPLGSPDEVGGVTFAADKQTLSWNSDAVAFTYDAVRGNVSALPVGPGGGDEICFPDISGTSTSDATVPASGIGFWYIVRGENTCAPAGTYGTQSNATPRTTTTCP